MKMLWVALLALSTASSAYAQHPTWLDEAIRVPDPDQLAYWISVDVDCPMTRDEVASIVEDVLIDNRIKPLDERIFEDGRVYLNLSLRCTRVAHGDTHAFNININFGRYKPFPPILLDAPYATFGIGSQDLIWKNCKELVKAAVTDFVKANALVIGRQQST